MAIGEREISPSNLTTIETQEADDITVSELDTTQDPKYLLSSMDSGKNSPESHRTASLAIMSIFLCITLFISVAVFIFYKKKNSVFSLQAEKDNDKDYEMDDIHTDMDSNASDKVSLDGLQQTSQSVSIPLMSRLCEYDRESILYIPYIPEDQSKSDFYQLLPRSKSHSSDVKVDTMITSTSCHKPESSASILSVLFKKSDKKSKSSLPFSRSYSCSSITNNYQSMTDSADIEPWVPQRDSSRSVQNLSNENDNCQLKIENRENSNTYKHDFQRTLVKQQHSCEMIKERKRIGNGSTSAKFIDVEILVD